MFEQEKRPHAEAAAEYAKKIAARNEEMEAGWDKSSLVNGLMLEIDKFNGMLGSEDWNHDASRPKFKEMKDAVAEVLKEENREDLSEKINTIIDDTRDELDMDDRVRFNSEELRAKINDAIE